MEFRYDIFKLKLGFGLFSMFIASFMFGNDKPAVNDSLCKESERVTEFVDTLCETIFVLNNIDFTEGSARVDSIIMMKLDEVALHLASNPDVQLKIIGYADSPGTSYFTFVLAKQRAMAITNYLISSGIDHFRLHALACGEDRSLPLKNNDTLEQLMGKIELVFTDF